MSFFPIASTGLKFIKPFNLAKINPSLFKSFSDIWQGLGKIGQTGVKIGIGSSIAGAGIFGATSAVNSGVSSITKPLETQTGIKGISTIFIGLIIFIILVMVLKK